MKPARGVTACLFLSLLGIGLASYLVFLHLGILRGELLGGAACGGTGAFNCHAVTGGAWGRFLGMPVAVWGLIGYLTVFALSLLARQSTELADHALTLIVLLASLFVGVDVALFFVMALVIRFYCLFCLLTYAVNLTLLLVAVRALGRPAAQTFGRAGSALGALAPSPQRPAAILFWGIMLVSVSGSVALHAATTFVSQGSSAALRMQLREFLSKQPRVSVDIAGDPMLGSPAAPIQIVEFSDFFCPACQRASKFNTIILASHRRDAAFVFKHFPLDTTCNDKVTRMVHPGACQVAAASECAHQQGKFWPFHDLLFERGHDYKLANLDGDAMRLGLDMTSFRSCIDSGKGMEAVKRDIVEAGKISVTSTPTYIINGIPVAGGINPSTFEDFVAVLREASR